MPCTTNQQNTNPNKSQNIRHVAPPAMTPKSVKFDPNIVINNVIPTMTMIKYMDHNPSIPSKTVQTVPNPANIVSYLLDIQRYFNGYSNISLLRYSMVNKLMYIKALYTNCNICTVEFLSHIIIFSAIQIVDNYLLQYKSNFSKQNCNLLVATAIWIASKYHSKSAIKYDVVLNMFDIEDTVSLAQFAKFEMKVLKTIKFELWYPTVATLYWSEFMTLDDSDENVINKFPDAYMDTIMSLLYLSIQSSDLFGYLPSHIVHSAFLITMWTLGNDVNIMYEHDIKPDLKCIKHIANAAHNFPDIDALLPKSVIKRKVLPCASNKYVFTHFDAQ